MLEIIELQPQKDKVSSFLLFLKEIDKETDFTLMNAGERDITESQIFRVIHDLNQKRLIVYLAKKIHQEGHSECVGYIMGLIPGEQKIAHTLRINIAVSKSFWGQKIGTQLLEKMNIFFLENNNLQRMELTVADNNTRAISLYTKSGFQIEGKKVKALKVREQFLDEYYMSITK